MIKEARNTYIYSVKNHNMSAFRHSSSCNVNKNILGQRAWWVFIIGRYGFPTIMPKPLIARMALDLQINFNL